MGCCANERKTDARGPGGGNTANVNKTLDEVYAKFDKDGNGGLDPEETRAFLNDMMKNSNQQVSDTELRNFISQVDKNRDGLLQKEEIYQLYQNISRARGQG